MRRVATAACLLLVLLTGCTGSAAKGAAPPPTTSDTAPGGAGADAASVNAVLAGLDGVMGDLQRILVKQRQITPDVTDRLRSIYTGPELLNQIDAFKADVASGLVGYKPVPGNRITTVSQLITATPICMFAQVQRDYSPLAVGLSSKPTTLYVALVNKDEADDPKHLNPTPWTMIYDGVQADGSQPEDPCRATS
ncbi:MAG TPA: hypothetical protein VHT97_05640 [Acidimicrobiales bacterium]|jgi:hypothetical protein|nr:hypothetical protein [Acidimicrobiales bacterium]